MFPVVVSADHSAAEDIGYHSATSSSCARGTDHDSTDWGVLGTSAGSLAEDWHTDEYCF